MEKEEFINEIERITELYLDSENEVPKLEKLYDIITAQAIAEHEATNIKLSPEIFNKVQLKRVARMLKELSEESWKAAGGDGREWNTWYLKRSTQHLNQSKEGGEG